MIKLIVYDLDGTLLDTAIVVLDLINLFREELKKPKLSQKEILPWLSMGGQKMIENALDLDANNSMNYLDKFRKKYLNTLTPKGCIYPEVEKTLEVLSKEYYLSICTNKPRKLAEKVLKETNLNDYFNYMCAGDDLTTKKPNRANLENCLEYFSVRENETVYVGDSTVDQKLANACKVKYLQYCPGYDDGVVHDYNTYKMQKHSDILNLVNSSSKRNALE